MSTSNTLMETTKHHFGDYASILLDGHAVIPLNNPSNCKAAVADWQNGWDPSRPVEFHSLAIRTGAPSGITVWDIDDLDAWSPPAPPNVLTAKGLHVYTPYTGERGRIALARKLDLLSDGRYAIFYGQDKTFRSPALTPSQVMTEWFSSLSSPCRETEKGYVGGLNDRVREQGYCEFLESNGYELDETAIRNQYVKTLPSVPEGARNATLYRYAREMVRCGLDLSDLETAAIASGLDRSEVVKTIESAEVSVILAPGKSVYDRVTFWLDNAIPLVPVIAHDVMREVARRAIETNDLAPFFPQQDIANRLASRGVVKERSTISKILTLLDSEWGVVKVVRLGRQPDGKRNPNAYRLCLGGHPISEVDR